MMQKKLPKNWQKSDRSLRAVQIAFEFNRAVADAIRQEASRQGLSPSDQIRKIIGLEVKKPLRPRLTVTLSEADYATLAKRFGLSPDDKARIRETIKDELLAHIEKER